MQDNTMLDITMSYFKTCGDVICGIDEAGRGCLCGSLFVAGVICNASDSMNVLSLGVRDSKTLSPAKRYKLVYALCAMGLKIALVRKSAKEIDSKGLSACMKEAIEEIIHKLDTHCKRFIFDGNTTFGVQAMQPAKLTTVIGGDAKLAPIAAASIIAKCAKDTESKVLHARYPHYFLHKNAGYGTRAHKKALQEYGLSPEHRKSFIHDISHTTLKTLAQP